MTHTVYLTESEFPDLTGMTPAQRNTWWAFWLIERVLGDAGLQDQVNASQVVMHIEGDDELNEFNARGLPVRFNAFHVRVRKAKEEA